MPGDLATPATLQVAATYLSGVDPILAPIIERVGLMTVTPHREYYRELVESIISQQLSVKAAAAIIKRFRALFGDSFPMPEEIIAIDVETYREVGLSRQKAGYIRDLAEKVRDGHVRFDHLDGLADDAIVEELTRIKGVGVWTVHMFLMFCMGRLNVLPVGDLGIRNGIAALYGFEGKPTPEEITMVAQDHQWAPYRSVASWYVWQSLNNAPIKD